MNALELDKLIQCYGSEDFFVIMDKRGIFFAESPEEQGLDPGAPQETVLRLFLDKDEADIYCDYVNVASTSAIKNGEMRIAKVSLQDLWLLLDDVEKISYYEFGCTVRIVLTMLDAEGWPVDLDTIHGNYITVN